MRKTFSLLLTALALAAGAAHGATATLQETPALRTPSATHAMLLGAARAGDRIVAVGDHGVVLLSDDNGRQFRQAQQVPTRALLTAVHFVDARNGWAVGHHGVVLHTADGGETWALQRSDTGVDQPLFSVLFRDKQHGFAVGLWSLLLVTEDGGHTWRKQDVPAPPGGDKSDRNFFRLFAGADGTLLIAAEQGLVLRSTDQGAHWSYQQTGYKGSFWSGASLRDGTLMVAGMRGTVYRSADGGVTWSKVESGTASSVTDLVSTASGVAGVGQDGATIQGGADGHLHAHTRADRAELTAVVQAADGRLVSFSSHGVVAPE